MKRENYRCRISSLCRYFVVITSLISAVACSDNELNVDPPDEANPTQPNPSGTDSPSTSIPSDQAADTRPDQSESSGGHLLRYPADTNNDDLPGLIVTGLSADQTDTQVSPFLLSASAFRTVRQTPGSGDAYVHMAVYDKALPVSAHIDFYQPPLGSCLLRDAGVVSEGVEQGGVESDGVERDDLELDHIAAFNASASGGAAVVINASNGPWHTFERSQSASDQYRYESDNALPGRLPAEATLSVPGDVFPNVSAYPLFEPDAPERVLPIVGNAVSPTSEYSWVAGAASGHVKINLLGYNDSDQFIGFVVTCWTADDGKFEMPATVVDYVASSPHTIKARYSRVYARLDWLNGMVVHQTIEVAE